MAGNLLSAADAAAAVDGIHQAMLFGLPPDPADRAVFVTPAGDVEPGFDPAVPMAAGEPTRVTSGEGEDEVLYALEYADVNGVVLESADIVPSVILLTMLGPDYDKVKGFRWVELGDERWFYEKTSPQLALGSVPVWQVQLKAEDDA